LSASITRRRIGHALDREAELLVAARQVEQREVRALGIEHAPEAVASASSRAASAAAAES
jgi:hypothetical protein